MFGRHSGHDQAEDDRAAVSPEPPSADERAHLLKKGKAVVGVIAAATASPQQDGTTIWHLDVTYTDKTQRREVQFVDRVESRFQFTVGEHLPIRIGSASIVDDVHLASRMAEERAHGSVPRRWTLPAYCPNCGAPVDQAVQALEADPRCRHCDQPLPVQ